MELGGEAAARSAKRLGLSAVDMCLCEEEFGYTKDALVRRAFGAIPMSLLNCVGDQRPKYLDRAVAGDINIALAMSYKDEYEVARLYSTPEWRSMIETEFENVQGMKLLLAPPLLSRVDPRTGRPAKKAFGPWIFPALRILSRFSFLRGTMFDPFGRTAERRAERALAAEVEAAVTKMTQTLTAGKRASCLAYLAAVDEIRGFGPVKEKALQTFHARKGALIGELEP